MSNGSEIKMHETNNYYRQGATLFLGFLKEKKKAPLPRNEETIKAFLRELKEGYPNNKPKAQGTVKAKLVAVKNLYKLNGVEDVDFESLYKYVPELFQAQTQQAS